MGKLVNKTQQGYTNVNNSILRNKQLSIKERGMLITLISLPDNWEFSIGGLAKILPDGKDSIRSSINKLEELGYVKRIQAKNDKGQWEGYDWQVFDEPITEEPITEEPSSGNPTTENPTQLNNNKLITNIENNNKEKRNIKEKFYSLFSSFSSDENTIALLKDWLEVRRAKHAADTERSIELNLQKLPSMAEQSGMSVNDYLEEVIRKGWQAFYPITDFKGKENHDGKRNNANSADDADKRWGIIYD